MFSQQPNIFPNLVPETIDRTSYGGFIEIKGKSFSIRLILPYGPDNMKDAKLSVHEELAKLLSPHISLINNHLKTSQNLDNFLLDFKDLLERVVIVEQNNNNNNVVNNINIFPELPPATTYFHILKEIKKVGWNKLEKISNDLTEITLKIEDQKGRKHFLNINFPINFPINPIIGTIQVPNPTQTKIQSDSIINLINKAKLIYSEYQEAWNMLEDIDNNCWVFEGDNQPFALNLERRIGIGKHCSISIDINPNNPRGKPDVRFFGGESVVGPLKELFVSSKIIWNLNLTVRENLQNIMQIQFPSNQSTNIEEKDQMAVECGICYSYKNDGRLPDSNCDNIHCARPFHSSCLAEWLSSLATSHHSFNTIFGECPYCSSQISVRL